MNTEFRNNLPLSQLLLQAFRWFDQSLLLTLTDRGDPELSPAQSLIFAHLDREGTRLSELARRIGVTRQAIHKTVSELKALDLIRLVPDPTNRSAKLVTLTPTGRKNVTKTRRAFADIERLLAERLDPETVAALRHALEQEWGQPVAVPPADER